MLSKSTISMFARIFCIFHCFSWSREMINSASLIICIDLPGDDLNTYRYSSGLHMRKMLYFFSIYNSYCGIKSYHNYFHSI